MPHLVRDRSTWLAYLALGFYVYIISCFGPLLPGLQADLGLDYTETSLHGTVFALGFIVIGLSGDRTIRRLGRRRTLWLAVAGAEGGAVLLALAPSLAVSLLAMLVIGGIGGFLIVVNPALLADRHGPTRGSAFAEANVMASAAAALAPLMIGLAIAAGASWRLGLVIPPGLVAVGIAIAFAGVLVDRTTLVGRRGSEAMPTALPVPRRLPRAFWSRWVTIVLVVAIEWCLVYWIAAYMESALGADPAMAAGSVGLFLLGMLMGRVAGTRLIARRRPESLLAASLCLAAVGFGLFWGAPGVGPALVGLIVAGLGVAMLYPLALERAVAAAADATDLAMTRALLASGVAIASGPFVLGALADSTGLRSAYLVVPVLVVLALVTVLRTSRGRRTMAQPA